jgi:hypothetical protein
MATPRIVQVLEDNSAAELMHMRQLLGHKIIALDDRGLLWSLGPGENAITLKWYPLPLPPLPETEGGNA